eukprot:m.1029119 g.1029119  ORF g.1029119 m.1029119 type:complete len:1050 (+) comp24113_c0_seq4:108-3257(+)
MLSSSTAAARRAAAATTSGSQLGSLSRSRTQSVQPQRRDLATIKRGGSASATPPKQPTQTVQRGSSQKDAASVTRGTPVVPPWEQSRKGINIESVNESRGKGDAAPSITPPVPGPASSPPPQAPAGTSTGGSTGGNGSTSPPPAPPPSSSGGSVVVPTLLVLGVGAAAGGAMYVAKTDEGKRRHMEHLVPSAAPIFKMVLGPLPDAPAITTGSGSAPEHKSTTSSTDMSDVRPSLLRTAPPAASHAADAGNSNASAASDAPTTTTQEVEALPEEVPEEKASVSSAAPETAKQESKDSTADTTAADSEASVDGNLDRAFKEAMGGARPSRRDSRPETTTPSATPVAAAVVVTGAEDTEGTPAEATAAADVPAADDHDGTNGATPPAADTGDATDEVDAVADEQGDVSTTDAHAEDGVAVPEPVPTEQTDNAVAADIPIASHDGGTEESACADTDAVPTEDAEGNATHATEHTTVAQNSQPGCDNDTASVPAEDTLADDTPADDTPADDTPADDAVKADDAAASDIVPLVTEAAAVVLEAESAAVALDAESAAPADAARNDVHVAEETDTRPDPDTPLVVQEASECLAEGSAEPPVNIADGSTVSVTEDAGDATSGNGNSAVPAPDTTDATADDTVAGAGGETAGDAAPEVAGDSSSDDNQEEEPARATDNRDGAVGAPTAVSAEDSSSDSARVGGNAAAPTAAGAPPTEVVYVPVPVTTAESAATDARIRELELALERALALHSQVNELAEFKEQAKTADQLTELRTAFEEEIAQLKQDHQRSLKKQKQKLAITMNERLVSALEFWEERMQERVPQAVHEVADTIRRNAEADTRLRLGAERAQRISTLEGQYIRLRTLESAVRANEAAVRAAVGGQYVVAAAEALRDGMEGKAPLLAHVQRLRRAAGDDILMGAALDGISTRALSSGVLSESQLQQKFLDVKRDVLRVQLVPPTGGLMAHLVSSLLSRLLVQRTGHVTGTSPDAIISRAEFFIQQGKLEEATREVNQLEGVQREAAYEWLEESRAHLEVANAVRLCCARASVLRTPLLQK